MKNKLYKIAPSILAADPMNIGRDAILAEKSGAYRLSVDVMDGHFVSDITFGSNYTLMSAIPDYGATIEVSSKF